ncbi:MAG: shikimate dehydrogenase [Roseicyclus sp.]|nr:shikimate dehydrogenase [Roseicyclus sp.]
MTLRLGLIGDEIAQSHAPALHGMAGRRLGVEVRYDRLVPGDLGQGFDTVFAAARDGGYRGVNITYPYKERVVPNLRLADPVIAAIGAVNTVTFGEDGPWGHNTDYSGFKAAYRAGMGATLPGRTLLVGAGGVGRAIAFALVDLGVEAVILHDRDLAKAKALASDITSAFPGFDVQIGLSAARNVNGLVNCTPVGMGGHPGNPMPRDVMASATWAFDAVYTPQETAFLQVARAAGLSTLSGWELFFHQGVDAWSIFSGMPVDEQRLRADLLAQGIPS